MYTLPDYLWPPQRRSFEGVIDAFSRNKSVCLQAPTGCHALGSKVLLYDRRPVEIEKVIVGDKLLGPDGKPRVVQRLFRGTAPMYTVIPVKGDRFTVTGDHLLTLAETGIHEAPLKDVRVLDWLAWSKNAKHLHKLIRSPIIDDWDEPELPIDPYLLGVLIGDGSMSKGSVKVHTPDKEIHDECFRLAESHSVLATLRSPEARCDTISLTGGQRGSPGSNRVMNEIRLMGLNVTSERKFIPLKYKRGSVRQRLELLAGLIDTDGHLSKGVCYDWISASEELANDVAFLSRSLGLSAYVSPQWKQCQTGAGGIYYRLSINGELSQIPCRVERKKAGARLQKKSVLKTGFSIETAGIGEYAGVLVDGDSRYLMADTTITHNSGKTAVSQELFKWAASVGATGCFYVNRRLLIGQTVERFRAAGLDCGIRAAEYPDQYDWSAPFQVCSADTEESRVYGKNKVWDLHDAKLVIVDEAHLQRTGVMWKIIQEYREKGALIVGLTATPIGLSEWYDELFVSGKLSEYRECGAIVPAIVKSIEQPDLRKVKRNATGEYVIDGKKKKIYTQSIVGSVLDRWKRYNPDGRTTFLYAPGVEESVWLTEQFMAKGISWCHIDATDAVMDGKRVKLTRSAWDDLMGRIKDGSIRGLSSRFKAREGLDLPFAYCAILATPIGSLASYIQIAGRVLRAYPGKDHALIIDHGGAYIQHGSPNHDRPWGQWWDLPEHAVSEWHVNQIRDKKTPEPIRCPKCEGERTGGIVCPHCGHTHEKSKRIVVMEDGEMREHEGRMIRYRVVQRKPDTQQLFERMFWGWRKKGVDRTFNQLAAYFHHENGYAPPRDLKFMPKSDADWYRKVASVPMAALHGAQ